MRRAQAQRRYINKVEWKKNIRFEWLSFDATTNILPIHGVTFILQLCVCKCIYKSIDWQPKHVNCYTTMSSAYVFEPE